MSGGELPLKNNKYTDEGSISLFDGHEDLLNDIVEKEPEETVAEEVIEPIVEVEDSSTQFVIEETPEIEEPTLPDLDGEDDTETVDDEETETVSDDETDAESPADTEQEAAAEPEEVAPTAQNTAAKPRRIDSIFDFIELFIFTLAAVFIITSFFFKYSNVVGDSMQNTLQSGEKLVLRSFLYNPKPGDVVVIDDRSLTDPIVKRVIAVGGQRVKITKNAIYVDGERLFEDYVYIDAPGGKYVYSVMPCEALLDNLIGYKEGEYYEILVPENEIFVMGDHRNKSYDSRDIGTLHEDSILGKAVIRFYPFDKFGKLD